VSVLAYGSPTSDGGDYIGTVNDDDWPVNVEGMTSKPTGYWLMNKFDTMTSKYQGYFTVDAAALTRTNEDWSEYGILRSRDTGRYAMVTDPDTPYETSSFATLFGFGVKPDGQAPTGVGLGG
jgi:hypothetical protein